MWVWLDRAGSILFDATLSTAIFLTLVVLVMLVTRQPSRRILIAHSALVASSGNDPASRVFALTAIRSARHADPVRPFAQTTCRRVGTNRASASAALSTEHPSQWIFASDLYVRLLGQGRWLPPLPYLDRSSVRVYRTGLAILGRLGSAVAHSALAYSFGYHRKNLSAALRRHPDRPIAPAFCVCQRSRSAPSHYQTLPLQRS